MDLPGVHDGGHGATGGLMAWTNGRGGGVEVRNYGRILRARIWKVGEVASASSLWAPEGCMLSSLGILFAFVQDGGSCAMQLVH